MSRGAERLSRALQGQQRKVIARQVRKPLYGIVVNGDPLSLEIVGSEITLEENDLRFSRWAREYRLQVGFEAEDMLLLEPVGESDWVVIDLLSPASDDSPIFAVGRPRFGAASIQEDSVSVPIGAVLDYAGRGDPSYRFMQCDGRLLWERDYPALYERIGTSWGAVEEPGSFLLPNLNGRSTVGEGDGFTLGDVGGARHVSLSAGELATHAHRVVPFAGVLAGVLVEGEDGENVALGGIGTVRVGAHDHDSFTDEVGAGAPHENMPPFGVCRKIIRVL